MHSCRGNRCRLRKVQHLIGELRLLFQGKVTSSGEHECDLRRESLQEQLLQDGRVGGVAAQQLAHTTKKLAGTAIAQLFGVQELVQTTLLRYGCALDELRLERVVRLIWWRVQDEIADFNGYLWWQRSNNVTVLRGLGGNASSKKLCLYLAEP